MNIIVVFIGLVLAVAMGYVLGTISLLWLLTHTKLINSYMKKIVDFIDEYEI